MKLTEKTLTVLKNFAQLNPSICVKKGSVLETLSSSMAVAAHYDCDETFPIDFAIYDLTRFLSILSLFNGEDGYKIKFKQNEAVVYDERSKVEYRFTDPELIISLKKSEPDYESDINFVLSQANLEKLLKATSILGAPEIAFVCEKGVISAKALDSTNSSFDEFSMMICKSTSKDFTVILKAENVKIISGQYNITVVERLTQFSSDEVKYWVANEHNSVINT